MIEYTDIGGKEIQVGSYIAYAAALGRCAILKLGVVVALKAGKVKAVTAEKVWRWGTGEDQWGLQKNGSPITLAFTERMVVVPRDSIPDEVLTLFEANEATSASKEGSGP